MPIQRCHLFERHTEGSPEAQLSGRAFSCVLVATRRACSQAFNRLRPQLSSPEALLSGRPCSKRDVTRPRRDERDEHARQRLSCQVGSALRLMTTTYNRSSAPLRASGPAYRCPGDSPEAQLSGRTGFQWLSALTSRRTALRRLSGDSAVRSGMLTKAHDGG